MTPPARTAPDWSPNQLEKRRQIIEAARVVLARDGLAHTTARAVADASPLTKSAIHYYFSDIDEIVDAAMAGHVGAFAERVRSAAEGTAGTPADRVVAAAEEYLATFREIPGGLVLWNEYWTDSVRRGRTGAVRALLTETAGILAGLLRGAGSADPALRAEMLMAFLLGTVMQQAVAGAPPDRLRDQLILVCGLDQEA